MTLYLFNGIIFKLSVSESVIFDSTRLCREGKNEDLQLHSKKKSIIGNNKTSTKGKEIHISCKANLVNKAKDVKSNFKALEMRNELVE